MFLNIQQKIDSLMFGDILRNVLKIDFKFQISTDLYVQFRPSDGMNALGARIQAQFHIFGINLGELNAEFQYIAGHEVSRRRQYFGQDDPCGIECKSFDEFGVCTEESKGIRPIDSFILKRPHNGSYMMLAFQYKQDKLYFPWLILVQLRDAHFYIAKDLSKKDGFCK
jgi:hypothetical protein